MDLFEAFDRPPRGEAYYPKAGTACREVLDVFLESYPHTVDLSSLEKKTGYRRNSIVTRISELKAMGWRILTSKAEYGMPAGLDRMGGDDNQLYQLLSLDRDEPYDKLVGITAQIESRPGNGGMCVEVSVHHSSSMEQSFREDIANRIRAILEEYAEAMSTTPAPDDFFTDDWGV